MLSTLNILSPDQEMSIMLRHHFSTWQLTGDFPGGSVQQLCILRRLTVATEAMHVTAVLAVAKNSGAVRLISATGEIHFNSTNRKMLSGECERTSK